MKDTKPFDWNESEILTDRKSKFQARCCSINSQYEINSLLQSLLLDNKAIAKASHPHMYAWRTADVVKKRQNNEKGKKNSSSKKNPQPQEVVDSVKNIQQGSADNGEAGAGQRLLTLLERANVINVLVVVTRWYGGTPLGPARFRHISSTAVQSLKIGKYIA